MMLKFQQIQEGMKSVQQALMANPALILKHEGCARQVAALLTDKRLIADLKALVELSVEVLAVERLLGTTDTTLLWDELAQHHERTGISTDDVLMVQKMISLLGFREIVT